MIPLDAQSISLDQWKELPPTVEKYDAVTLELLRASDPKLESDKEWKAFMNAEVGPQMALDFPEQFE